MKNINIIKAKNVVGQEDSISMKTDDISIPSTSFFIMKAESKVSFCFQAIVVVVVCECVCVHVCMLAVMFVFQYKSFIT
jgi:hypothetical protein